MNYTVYGNGGEMTLRTAAVYPAPYHCQQTMEYLQFVWKEPVTLRIVSKEPVRSVVLRPLSLHMTAEADGHEIRLCIEKPVKLSLEINGKTANNLLILAEENRYEAFETKREHVMYFPAGVHETGILTINQDDTVLYLEEGAYLHGKIDLNRCSRVTVCGYGVVSMERYSYEMRPTYSRCVDAVYCRNVVIRDITIMDSNDWSLRICGCEDVLVDNVKIFGCRGNSDGVDVCGSRRVLVENVFTRVWDDSLVVKALDTGDVEDVVFRNCILWNDFARPMEVGVELRADRVRRIRFENIDVLHSPTGYPLMGIHHGDRAAVSDVVFDGIRIEDAPGAQLFDVRITPSYWNRDERMGCIRDVTFRNIHMTGSPGLPYLLSDSRLQGYDEEHDICGVVFEKIDICGKTPASVQECGLSCRDYVRGVSFLPDRRLEPIRLVESRMELSRPFVRREDGAYEGEVTVRLKNTADTEQEKEIWLQISPAHLGAYDGRKRRVTLPAGEECAVSWKAVLQPGKYCIALQSDDPDVRYAFLYEQLDWVLGAYENRKTLTFVNYWEDRLGEISAWACDGCLVLDSALLEREDCTLVLYTALPVEREEGEVLFSVEETDFGAAPALLYGAHGTEAAPQLRCPLEITLVFKNQPKVKEIHTFELAGGKTRTVSVPFADLGLPEQTAHFWMEIEARVPEVSTKRYPYTLFHSVSPLTTAHMYGNCRLEEAGPLPAERHNGDRED